MRPALFLIPLLLVACSKKEKSPGAETSAAAAEEAAEVEPAAEEPAADCQQDATEAKFQELQISMDAYASLEFPRADADCETLRLFAVELSPLAQATFGHLQGLKEGSQKLSDECRALNKEHFGPRLEKLMKGSEAKLGPQMESFESAVRACKDHPGMAEAFGAASFPVAR